MRSLIIDNYDSFTYNVFQAVGEITGEEPIVVKNDEATWESLQQLSFDNIIISPGPGRPERPRDFGVSAEAILNAKVPVLGVCLGHQGIAHLFGGSVVSAPQPMHGRLSEVFHDGTGVFADLPNPINVVRYHSLVVGRMPDALRTTATTADGIIMALEHRSRPIHGVQFHPESICAELGGKIFENFTRLTEQRAGIVRSFPPVPSRTAPAPAAAAGTYRAFWRKASVFPNALTCFRSLFAARRNAFWLDSSMVVPSLSRFSFMGDGEGPLSHLLKYDVNSGTLRTERGDSESSESCTFFDALKHRLEHARVQADGLPFDLLGGYVGYVGYEMKKECGARSPHASPVPDAQLLFADRLVVLDHQEHCTYLVCIDLPEQAARAGDWLHATQRRLEELANAPPPARTRPNGSSVAPSFHLRDVRDAYVEKIEACRELIGQGETYEVCLTNKMFSSARPDPMALYEELRWRNPAPYAAFLRYGELQVLSSSPERFLKIDARRNAESKPIKGTQRRGRSKLEDLQLREELASSEKNRSENLMIVDLVRNDLGRICEIGSVRVPRLMAIEEYATVHQMVSTVTGTLREGVSSVDAFRSAFPGGSMTGAPKLRTMEIIDELEAAPRGIYSGAIGYFSLSGGCDFNIVIRTIQINESGLSIGTGGAIIALSDAPSEYDEILLKVEAPMRSIRGVLGCTGEAAPPVEADMGTSGTSQTDNSASSIEM
jgi:para-aminobenzoate synthetase